MRGLRFPCAVGALVAISLCGVAVASDRDTAVSAPLDFAPGFGEPDQFGGYSTQNIVVKLTVGMTPVTDVAGGFTIDGGQIDDLCRGFGAQGFDAVFSGPFANPKLADAIGLSRTYRIYTPAGTDTLTFAALLANVPGVETAEIDGIGGIAAIYPTDPFFPVQWGLNNTNQDADIDAPEAWSIYTGGADVTVAIVDTGVQSTHPDLTGRVLPGWCTYCSPQSSSSEDVHGHGTHVSGILGAIPNNGQFGCGINWGAMILPVRCLSSSGTGTESQCADAIEWAADHGADIISMSLQYYTGGTPLSDAVNYAFGSGVLLIAAAGNNRGNTIAYPARFDHCMCVGATTQTDTVYSGSNYGPQVDLSAPGVDIYSTWFGSSSAYQTGTSMATPFVSGTAALLMSYNHSLSIADIEDILKSTTDDLGTQGWDQYFGTGRLNTYSALIAALPGDVNCDGVLNNFDIDPFVLAVGDGAAYSAAFPECSIRRADMNSDGVVNNFDIDGFVSALAGD